MNPDTLSRLRGIAVGAAIGDALGMPLEFGPRIPADRLVRTMQGGRLAAGAFTDDTEMALALAESLLARFPLDGDDLSQRFLAWYQAGPDDVGNQTRAVLSRVGRGAAWQNVTAELERTGSHTAGNGSVMRCWPVAIACAHDRDALIAASELQSRVTHAHPECITGSAFINLTLFYLLQGRPRADAVQAAHAELALPAGLREAIAAAPARPRTELPNSGWVRHTVESAVWGLLTTASFEEAVVQVVNLGNDADSAGAVVGALAGAAYGLEAIPAAWRAALHGEWPMHSRNRWDEQRLIALADDLARSAPR